MFFSCVTSPASYWVGRKECVKACQRVERCVSLFPLKCSLQLRAYAAECCYSTPPSTDPRSRLLDHHPKKKKVILAGSATKKAMRQREEKAGFETQWLEESYKLADVV